MTEIKHWSGCRKLEFAYIFIGLPNGTATMEESFAVSCEFKYMFTI